jgi:hypothetical protein
MCDHIMAFPEGYDTKAGEMGVRLGGSENLRVLLGLKRLADGKSHLSIIHWLSMIKGTDL